MTERKTLQKWEKTSGANNIIKHLLINKKAEFQELRDLAGYGSDDNFIVQLSRSKVTQRANVIGYRPIISTRKRNSKGLYTNTEYSINPLWYAKEIASNKELFPSSPFMDGEEMTRFIDRHHEIIIQLHWDSIERWRSWADITTVKIEDIVNYFVEALKQLAAIHKFGGSLSLKLKPAYDNEKMKQFLLWLMIQRDIMESDYLLYNVIQGFPNPNKRTVSY